MSAPLVVVAGMLTGDHPTVRGVRLAEAQLGGGCVYAAAGARIWTSSIAIAAVAGCDYPEVWIEDLGEAGIDVTGVKRVTEPHAPTLLDSEEEFDSDAVRRRDVLPHGPAEAMGYADWDDPEEPYAPRVADLPSRYLEAGGVHIAPMGVTAVEEWVDATRGRALVTLDNPWWRPGAASGRYLHILNGLDALLPSEADISAYFGKPFEIVMLHQLAALGVRVVVAKVGAGGCFIIDARSTEVTHIPSIPVTLVDPTGAGDAFCGGFLASLLETNDPVLAAVRGSVSASAAIETFGISGALRLHARERDARERFLLKRIEARTDGAGSTQRPKP